MQPRATLGVLVSLLLTTAIATPEFPELSGFSQVTSTYVDGEFEGADFDKPLELENGMAFQFTTYYYTYAYRPRVDVFKRVYSVAELKALKVKNVSTAVTLYKLLIGNHVYSAFRIR
ncbi:hypothetical protein MF271_00665 (plasmid) [Deinococcus sp. KNUC1210]|uniref:hypothetical protein n=1 Tax=Deinococcus sp. KNUC1210 TaxID=2917691 RepID=UPI001EEFAF1E|nr:hypothetical protein [Deinococcus sp. KNUC1210]ULH14025.1 hypothetical protein MF271_00665 [Deinococcus sp. KNUC1210]